MLVQLTRVCCSHGAVTVSSRSSAWSMTIQQSAANIRCRSQYDTVIATAVVMFTVMSTECERSVIWLTMADVLLCAVSLYHCFSPKLTPASSRVTLCVFLQGVVSWQGHLCRSPGSHYRIVFCGDELRMLELCSDTGQLPSTSALYFALGCCPRSTINQTQPTHFLFLHSLWLPSVCYCHGQGINECAISPFK